MGDLAHLAGPTGKVTQAIAAGHVWLLYDGGVLIATITAEPEGDRDFWTLTELAEPALYVSKLAVRRSHAGQVIGSLLLAWARDRAYRQGLRWGTARRAPVQRRTARLLPRPRMAIRT